MSDKENIKNLRWTILEMVQRAGEGHIPSSFSVLELLYAIYSTMGTDDVFFLSKGHASAAFYAVLAHFGRIPARAAPTAAPVMAFSETGVSITRSAPNRSRRP